MTLVSSLTAAGYEQTSFLKRRGADALYGMGYAKAFHASSVEGFDAGFSTLIAHLEWFSEISPYAQGMLNALISQIEAPVGYKKLLSDHYETLNPSQKKLLISILKVQNAVHPHFSKYQIPACKTAIDDLIAHHEESFVEKKPPTLSDLLDDPETEQAALEAVIAFSSLQKPDVIQKILAHKNVTLATKLGTLTKMYDTILIGFETKAKRVSTPTEKNGILNNFIKLFSVTDLEWITNSETPPPEAASDEDELRTTILKKIIWNAFSLQKFPDSGRDSPESV